MIPHGWEESTLNDSASVIDCKHRTPLYVEDGIPLISPGTIKWGALDLSIPKKRVTKEEYESLMDHCSINIGDLVMGRNQSVGIAAYIASYEPFVLGQDTILIQARSIESKYLFYALQSNQVQRKVFKLAGGSTFSRINLGDIRKLAIAYPPLPEQKKIAQILSTWDKAIETVEKLIENSQQKKKALMQQLLTGKKRFSEFNGEWKEMRLGKLCKFMKGQGLSKEKLSDSGQYKCILYGELYTRYSEVISNVFNKTDHNEGVKSESGDVLIPASTTTSGIDLANATSLKESGVLLSGDINVLRTDKGLINPDFLAYILTHVKKHDLARRAQGITIIHLYGKDIKHIKIMIPALAEQRKIVSVIASADQEIETWQQELAHLKQEKKALMQQLLTGKRRVRVDVGKVGESSC